MSISAVLSSLESAVKLGKELLELRDQASCQKAVIELNQIILSAQDSAISANKERLDLQEENAQLKKRIAEFEGKADERSRYQRTDMGGRTFAYTLKDGPADHALCANCFEQGHSSTLQMVGESSRGQRIAKCPSCKTAFGFGTPERREPNVVRGSTWTKRPSRFGG
jgi:hypothetical protein